jgi:Protein of unknown function (DUF2914)
MSILKRMSLTTWRANAKSFYQKHEHALTIGFFVGGFIFDVLMMGRIDSWETIGQQVIYLLLISWVLLQMFLESAAPINPGESESLGRWQLWWRDYRVPIMHFAFGTLLNMYAIFYFTSSSWIASFTFLIILVSLLIINESSKFKAAGLAFKFGLLALCWLSFAALIVPVMLGQLGTLIFLFSMLLGTVPMAALGWWIYTYRPHHSHAFTKQILWPTLVVVGVFVGSYALKITPPVPVSLPFIGIYHDVTRTPEGYQLFHEREWWRFWHNGDQTFRAQPGDRVHVAFRIFSPARFADTVTLRWRWYHPEQGWIDQDRIPIRIVGGREEGFRGHSFKANYQPGHWRVLVETNDGREIGRLSFSIEQAPAEASRQFKVDQM